MASSKSASVTRADPRRAAPRAASLTTFARSAPTMPGVRWATVRRFTSGPSFTLRTCTFRISSRPLRSGRSTSTWRSKRPARSRAWSRTSGRLVAAMMITPPGPPNPSISTRSWLSVCSRSSWVARAARPPRDLPMASSSSMKTMQGAFFLASSKRSRMRAAPRPTNISTNSDPESEKKATPASPATAFASSVLPVPGGPTSSTPLGMRAPRDWYFAGFFRKSTTSTSSASASSTPATSSNVTLCCWVAS